MYKNYIHVQIDDKVFRINKKDEKVLFFYHILLKKILTDEETKLLRKYLVGRKYDKVFEMDKLKNMVKRITEKEFEKIKKCKIKKD